MLSEKYNIDKYIIGIKNLKKDLDEFLEIFNIAHTEKDYNLINDLQKNLKDIKNNIEQLELQLIFTSQNDLSNAFVEGLMLKIGQICYSKCIHHGLTKNRLSIKF